MPTNTIPTQLRILVPLDFSKVARVVLRAALRVATAPQSKLFLFYVPGLYQRTSADRVALANPFNANIVETYRRQFLEWANENNQSGAQLEVLSLMGLPQAGIIAEMARRTESSLIIVAQRHYTLWRRLFGPCPIQTLPHIAPCPVRLVNA